MKLLYIHNAALKSTEANLIQVISMCNAFASNGIRVTLALPESNMSQSEAVDACRNQYGIENHFDIAFFKTHFSESKINKYLNAFALRNVIEKHQPDVCFLRSAKFLSPVIKTGIPVVFESHNATGANGKNWINKLWKSRIVRSTRKANFVKMIAISGALKQYWVSEGISSDKIQALHDGFNEAAFKDAISRRDARKALELPETSKIIVYTGSLYPNREIENVIILANHFPDVLFLVVGGPEKYREAYLRKIEGENLTNLKLIGRKSHNQIPLYLYAADVLLALWSFKVPTINYCSPLKLFEYMASGRNIVAHAFPTIKEVVEHNKTALLSDPRLIDDLIAQVRIGLSINYPSKLAERARMESLQKYSWTIRAQKILTEIVNHSMFRVN